MEEGQIPLLLEGEPKVLPSSRWEKEMPMLPIPMATDDIQKESENNGAQEGIQEEQPGTDQTTIPLPVITTNLNVLVIEIVGPT